MFSIGEIVVLAIASAWVFGPKELPRVAKAAGLLTGRATGFLYRTRAKLFKFAEETEMTKLHEEMQATMYQLNAIRSELQGGISLFQPGPLTQRVLNVKPMPPPGGLASAPAASAAAPTLGEQHAAAAAAAGVPHTQQHAAAGAAAGHALRPPQQQADTQGSWAASAVLAGARAPQPGTQQALQAAAAQRQQRQQQWSEEGLHPLTVQVSAVAAGWLPDRSGRAPTGSEVVLDALSEELVAAQVLRFQQQQAQQQQVPARQAQQQQVPAAQQQQQSPAEPHPLDQQRPGDSSKR